MSKCKFYVFVCVGIEYVSIFQLQILSQSIVVVVFFMIHLLISFVLYTYTY
jgi:hypothetical protein